MVAAATTMGDLSDRLASPAMAVALALSATARTPWLRPASRVKASLDVTRSGSADSGASITVWIRG